MSRKPTTYTQQAFRFRRWGGRREGAGRKRSRISGINHVKRPAVCSRYPNHVTLKLHKALGTLRTKARVKCIRDAIAKACGADGFRVIDWSIQTDHVHLIIEAASAQKFSRGMQGLCIRIARGLNKLARRSGSVFVDRYHVRVLKTPREVRNARAYVLQNNRRHGAQRGLRRAKGWVDPFSSGAWFDGWKDLSKAAQAQAQADAGHQRCSCEPNTWLMRVGWRRHGLVAIDEIPGTRK